MWRDVDVDAGQKRSEGGAEGENETSGGREKERSLRVPTTKRGLFMAARRVRLTWTRKSRVVVCGIQQSKPQTDRRKIAKKDTHVHPSRPRQS